jgi:hypothetical protein
MKTKTTKAKVEGEGYKGHRPGSKIGQLHECFDKKGEDVARKLGEKLGLAPATINIQLSIYRKKKSAAKPAKPAKRQPRKADTNETHVAAQVIE